MIWWFWCERYSSYVPARSFTANPFLFTMINAKPIIVFSLTAVLVLTALMQPPRRRPILLFDGRTFAGWTGDTIGTWHIRRADRALVGGSTERLVPHNEFLTTTRDYTNFDLRLKFKLIGTGFVNAGVQFRSRRADQPAYEMIGYQADLGAGYWASLYDESRRNRTLAQPDSGVVNRVLRPGDWNEYRIRCVGRRIQLWLNDQPTVDYVETDQSLPQTGLIGLQIHGGGRAEVSYKDLLLTELP